MTTIEAGSNDRIRQFLELRDLGPHGLEVILRVVNEQEEKLTIRGSMVLVEKDGQRFGYHKVAFLGSGPDRVVELGQFEVAEGHFHIEQEVDHRLLHFTVYTDYIHGDEEEIRKISRRIATQSIRRRK